MKNFIKKLVSISLATLMISTLTVTASASGFSEIESNNTLYDANTIPVNTEISGNIYESGDEDYYSFSLDEPSKVTLDLPKIGTDSWWVFKLLDENGARVTEEIEYTFGSDFAGDVGTLRLPEGTYYIRISEWNCTDEDYKFTVNTVIDSTQQKTDCELGNHKLTVKNKKASTYFAKGYTGDKVCSECKKTITKGKSIAKKVLSKPSSISATATKNGITVKWKSVSGATGYEIYRANSKNGTYKIYKKSKSTSYTDASVKGGTKYFYKVKAYITQGSNTAKSAFSSIKSTTAKLVIKSPTKITCSKKLIKWNKGKNAEKYQIRVYDKTKKSKLVFSTTTKKTSIKAKFTKNHKYIIKVRSVAGKGKSKVYSEYKTHTYNAK